MMCISYVATGKMAISHSDHLFVSLTVVFCLLSSLARVSDSYDYTGDSRPPGKKLAVSQHGNNTQRLPNYNWKPPDKQHGPREESSGKKAATEFTKAEDPGQRATDPRIKKMQEIRRQEREKWPGRKRDEENGRLGVLDIVEGTTRASELARDESITTLIPSESTESHGNGEEGSGSSEHLFRKGDESPKATAREIGSSGPRKPAQHRPANQSDASDTKASQNSTELRSKQSTSANESSREKVSSHRWGMSVKKPPAGFLRDAYATHQRDKKADRPSESKRKAEKEQSVATKNQEKSKPEKVREGLLGSTVNSHGRQPTSHRPRSRDTLERRKGSHGNSKSPKDNGSLKREKHRLEQHPAREHPAKKQPRQSSLPRGGSEGSSESCDEEERMEKGDEEGHAGGKVVTAGSSTRKSKEEKEDEDEDEETTDDTRGKDATEKPLNHRRSFQPGRWGMSVSSPPAEFLRDASWRAMHRKNKERAGDGEEEEEEEKEEDERVHRTDRWDVSGLSSPGEEFLGGMPELPARGRGSGRSTVKSGSRPGEVKGSPADRPPAAQRPPDLQGANRANEDSASAALAAALPNEPGDHLADVPRTHHQQRRPDDIDFNNNPRGRILIHQIMALWSYIGCGADSPAADAHYRVRSPGSSLRK
ncbi:glutamic acid-rich protein [Harpegnathos saltator]|uniref:glutamic acid-rich protein n=1 Tax=Harpegnathos saltator TaxID=610380 RepID=UPI000948CC5D|nr:glutamic acid-rich protein [Harpegnathos saltator]